MTSTVAKTILVALGTLVSSSCDRPDDPSRRGTAAGPASASVYYNGSIVTMEGDEPRYVEALVEEGGRITFVGSQEEAMAEAGPESARIDLQGRTLLPGFIDGHGHIYNTGLLSLAANALPAPDGPGTDFHGLVEAVRAWTETDNGAFLTGKMGWIMANGYDDSQLEEKAHPTRDVLDRISTTLPVVVIHQSGHLASVNTRALELIGYTSDTEDVEGGLIRRDRDGNPTGVLEEAAFFNALLPVLAEGSDEELQLRSVLAGQEQYARYGYTTAQDGRSTADATGAFEMASARGDLYIDVVAYPDIIWNRDAVTPAFHKADRSYTGHYRVGGVKLTLDGSPQGKTAWLSECYYVNPAGQDGCYTGYPVLSDEEATEHVTAAFANQWQILAHTNGDAAIDQFLRAVEAAQATHGYDDHRTVMIHGQTLREDQVGELVRLGVLPSLFPMHTFYWGDWHRESVLGEERAAFISPTRSVLDAGLKLTSHHDAPVTFPNSLRVLDATVNRVTRSGEILGPDQRLTPYEGLKALTEWAAIQHFEEGEKGTLSPGKLADLVILDRNPLTGDPLTIHQIQVMQTIKEGVTVYRSEEQVGGWEEAVEDEQVREAVAFVMSQMDQESPLDEILSVRRQVVRGFNYEVTFRLDDNSVWSARVNRGLDGEYTLLEEPMRR